MELWQYIVYICINITIVGFKTFFVSKKTKRKKSILTFELFSSLHFIRNTVYLHIHASKRVKTNLTAFTPKSTLANYLSICFLKAHYLAFILFISSICIEPNLVISCICSLLHVMRIRTHVREVKSCTQLYYIFVICDQYRNVTTWI